MQLVEKISLSDNYKQLYLIPTDHLTHEFSIESGVIDHCPEHRLRPFQNLRVLEMDTDMITGNGAREIGSRSLGLLFRGIYIHTYLAIGG